MSPTRRLSPGTPLTSLRACLAIVTIAALGACAERAREVAPFEPQFGPGGGGPPVKVTGTDPTGAEQEQTLDVRVFGSNFEPGSNAEYTLNGASGKVHTNSTTFVSSSELVTSITIDAEADLGLYDVEVMTPPGKKGVGTELFEVRVKGGGPATVPINFEATGAFVTALESGSITTDSEDLLEFGAGRGDVVRTTHFNLTADIAQATGYAECASKTGNQGPPLSNADMDDLIVLLRDQTRIGGFNGAVDKTSTSTDPGQAVPSDVNHVGSMTSDLDPTPLQHVTVGAFKLLPHEGPTVVEIGTDTYAFSGGVVQIWDRSATVKRHRTLQCPNYDTVIVTIHRLQ